jgi:DNA-directed RNA polymerase subunit RPC12/RpoP
MKMKCAVCKRLTDENYRAIQWHELAVCEECAQKLLEKKVAN